MPVKKRNDPKDEIERRGTAIYDEVVKPQLKPKDKGKFAAIDIQTQDYAIAEDGLGACLQLNSSNPDHVWLVRIGSPYLSKFGWHMRKRAK